MPCSSAAALRRKRSAWIATSKDGKPFQIPLVHLNKKATLASKTKVATHTLRIICPDTLFEAVVLEAEDVVSTAAEGGSAARDEDDGKLFFSSTAIVAVAFPLHPSSTVSVSLPGEETAPSEFTSVGDTSTPLGCSSVGDSETALGFTCVGATETALAFTSASMAEASSRSRTRRCHGGTSGKSALIAKEEAVKCHLYMMKTNSYMLNELSVTKNSIQNKWKLQANYVSEPPRAEQPCTPNSLELISSQQIYLQLNLTCADDRCNHPICADNRDTTPHIINISWLYPATGL
jgi:hypothetical protein